MGTVSNMYSGLAVTTMPVNTSEQISAADSFFQNLVSRNSQDSVVSVYLFPTAYGRQASPIQYDISKWTALDGYTPFNKKLLTFPYTFLLVDCGNDSRVYRMEYFRNQSTMTFIAWSAVNASPKIALVPVNYNGTSSSSVGDALNVTEELIMTGFPQVAFQIDSYRAWVAQHSVNDILSGIGAAVGAVGSFASGNIGGALQGGIGVAQQVNSSYIEATKGNTVRGSQTADTDIARRKKNFYFKRMALTYQAAQRIDNFFSRYGYAVNRIKLPSLHNRQNFTYVKTANCDIGGNIPNDAMTKICSIFDKGITWWVNPSLVGNYTAPNEPLGGH